MPGMIPLPSVNLGTSSLPFIQQQHGDPITSPIQDQRGTSRTWIMHSQIHHIRLFMQGLISSYLKEMLRSGDWEGKHVDEVIRHLDERLFKNANSMEDYMEMSTLALRLDYLVSHRGYCERSELFAGSSSSSSCTGSVMLNRSMPHNVKVHPVAPPSLYDTVVSSTSYDIVPPNSSGSLLPSSKGISGSLLQQCSSASDGFIECHKRVSHNSLASAGNNMLLANSLLGRNTSQLMPMVTTSHSEDIISGDGSSVLSGREQQNPQFGYQSGRIFQNGSGEGRSGLSQMPSCNEFPNGTHNVGLAFTGNTFQMSQRMTAPQGYLSSYPYFNFLNPSQIHFDATFDRRSTQNDCSCLSSASAAGVSEGYQDVSSLRFQPNFTSNNSWESAHLNLQTSEQAPLRQHHQNLLYEKHSADNVTSCGADSEGILHGITHMKYENITSDQVPLELQAQVSQQINEQVKSGLPQHFVGGSGSDPVFSSENVAVAQDCNWSSCGSGNIRRKMQDTEVLDQQKLLLLYYHARGCSDRGECINNHCKAMKKMLNHMTCCKDVCSTCFRLHKLLDLHRNCWDSPCFICLPIRNSLYECLPINFGVGKTRNSSCRISDGGGDGATCSISGGGDVGNTMLISSSPTFDAMNLHPFSKRLKLELPSLSCLCNSETTQESLSCKEYAPSSPRKRISHYSGGLTIRSKPCESSSQGSSATVSGTAIKVSEIVKEVKPGTVRSIDETKPCETSSQESSATVCQIKSEYSEVDTVAKPCCWPKVTQELVSKSEREINKVSSKDKTGPKGQCNVAAYAVDYGAGIKLVKPKITGVSLVESFTSEKVSEHIKSLRKWVGLSKAKVEKNKAMEYLADKSSCQLCGMGDLYFEPPPMYCAKCYGRIKHNRAYYATPGNNMAGGDAGRSYFCNPCYNGSRGDNITYIGGVVSKKKLEKKRNDVQVLELWVQCAKCEAWQHQICALFNGKKNEGGRAEFTCPKCYLKEIQRGELKPLPQCMILGANDLPKSKLSEHIEQRLFNRLTQERQERADNLGKNFLEVDGVEDLTVRVVSSVDKKLEVKPLFHGIFKEDNYPAEFPYKSKAILLFQKIEGADVCLFGMYVQEFGSECPYPNQRRVCLSYIDSVKYFRPEIKAVTGESLRTFVYHEILIGYLDYCKKRGFTSCYIWSCPPLKQEDFILNCHPEIQKTPKPDKLREWYLAMLRKAAKENIVVDHTKLYDYFFMSTGECKAKVTAARLPYFDGDYWPGFAEDLLKSFQQQEDGQDPQKKGKMSISKRALKAIRHGALTDNQSKDNILMFKIGDAIRPMREDLIMVHLQHICSHCCELIISGKRWVCDLCKNFQLCDECHYAEQKLDKDRHPVNSKEKHSLLEVEVNDVPANTNDDDDNIQSELFDSRLTFLSLCQGNHYQYDTLRRAKYSTMMILYHLHNPTAPAFVSLCSDCHNDIETGQGWHCETCPEYDMCDSCYQREGAVRHIHELVRQTSFGVRDVLQNKGTQERQAPRIQDLLDLLVHASRCRATSCTYPFCHNVKGLFHHGVRCQTRVSGGCLSCKKMWYILQLHARACKEGLECHVPRCRDLKDHLKKMESQSDFRRRAGVMERMRQLEASVVSGDSE